VGVATPKRFKGAKGKRRQPRRVERGGGNRAPGRTISKKKKKKKRQRKKVRHNLSTNQAVANDEWNEGETFGVAHKNY